MMLGNWSDSTYKYEVTTNTLMTPAVNTLMTPAVKPHTVSKCG